MFLRILFILLATCGAARADVTWHNFTDASLSVKLSHKDQNLDHVHIDSGAIYQVGPELWYVTAQDTDCGFLWSVVSPFCGFMISYSTDLKHWWNLGHLFDATTQFWQDRCAGNGNHDAGCAQLRGIYNTANNNWVFWFIQLGPPAVPVTNAMFVMTCTTPAGEADGGTCTLQPSPTFLASDFSFFKDDDNSGWIIYRGGTFDAFIRPLNSTYTDGTGSATSTGLTGEGSALFKNAGRYYAQEGSACDACSGGASATFVSASTVQGTYGSPVTISGCQGQSYGTVTLTTPGPNTVQLFTSNQFYGGNSQGLISMYYQPLSFSGGSVVDPGCNATVVIPGLTEAPFPSPSPTSDQTSYVEDKFTDFCFINASNAILQTFVPTKALLSSVSLSLAQQPTGANNLDGDLTVSLVTLDGSNNPVSTLKSVIVSRASLLWGTRYRNLAFNYTIPSWSPGTPYGLKLTGAGTNGCVASTRSNGPGDNVYPAGVQKYSTDGGSTWIPQAGFALMFSSFSDPVADAGRRRGPFR